MVSGERSVLLATIEDRARRAAAGLRSLGLQPGGVVAILMRNDVPFFEAVRAAELLGSYALPVNWHLPPSEVAAILADCGAPVLVGHADLLRRHSLPPSMHAFGVDTPPEVATVYRVPAADCTLPADCSSWDGLIAANAPLEDAAPAGTIGSMFYSSGTTGLPKAIRRLPRTAEQTAAYGRLARQVYGIEPGMVTVAAGPLYHSAPFFHATQAVKAGGTVILQPRFDARGLLELVERHHVTNLLVVPTMLTRLLLLPQEERTRYDLSSLRHVVHGAAPMPPDVKRRTIKWLGPIIWEYYGCSESGIVTACSSEEWLAHPGSVGRAVAGSTVRVVRDNGDDAAPGEWGTILVRNPAAGDFDYPGNEAEERETKRDGLVCCGDVGHFDAGGYLYLDDRQKDMVISGGVNLFPAEIERAVMELPGVADVAVFGIPDADYGEALAAILEPAPGATLSPAAIREFLHQRLGGGLKVPRLIELRPNLPRDDAGKLRKRELRAPYWSARERAI
ncbi:MAG: AMP-binding protein [Chloroflexi bacterium]|nr:AMP-binding protein [Chloroflexota bacterium]